MKKTTAVKKLCKALAQDDKALTELANNYLYANTLKRLAKGVSKESGREVLHLKSLAVQ